MNTGERSDEYERFEELTRRLAQVPKKEVDDLEATEPSRKDPSDDEKPDASEDRSVEEERS